MIRFSVQLGFRPDPALFECAKENVGLLRDISAERIAEEFKKIILCGPLKGLLMLKATGALFMIFPELKGGEGFPQTKKYHRYSVLMHNILTCAHTPEDFGLRLAGLLHDVTKPQTMQKQGNMHGHEVTGASLSTAMLERLRLDRATIRRVHMLVLYHMYDISGIARASKVRRLIQKLGPECFRDLIVLRRADVWGSGMIKGNVASADRFESILNDMIQKNVPFCRKDLAVTGADIMDSLGIKNGEMVGEILAQLLKICSDKPAQNERTKLLCWAKKFYRSTNDCRTKKLTVHRGPDVNKS